MRTERIYDAGFAGTLAATGMWMTLLAIMQEFLKARQNVEMFYGEEMKEEREAAKNRQEGIHKH